MTEDRIEKLRELAEKPGVFDRGDIRCDITQDAVNLLKELPTELPFLLSLYDTIGELEKDAAVAVAAREFVYGNDCTDDAVEMHGTQSHSAPVAYMEFYTRVREIDDKPITDVIAERERNANDEKPKGN